MKLTGFTDLLESNPDKPFLLLLPGQKYVPANFHITEVGHVKKKFIDCGGKVHNIQTCLLQVWVYTDDNHRLLAGKMVKALNVARAKDILPDNIDLDLEIEYEDVVISQYRIRDHTVTDTSVIFELGPKHTDCLAKESCLPSLPMAAGTNAVACCGPGCC